ncbi:MAG: NmrA/HSCARG family protein, partial [Jatrophihabitantaceae bacterium]
ATGTADRIRLAELFSQASGHRVTAGELTGDALPPGLPDGLRAMFADYDRHGLHGGNSLVLQAILDHAPRSITDYVTELVSAP